MTAPRRAAFPRTYPAAVLSVHDGDTLTALLDEGADNFWRTAVRLDGGNAIELRNPGGAEAQQELAQLVAPVTPVTVVDLFALLNGPRAAQIEVLRYDKYSGRVDGRVVLPDGRDVVQTMIAAGYMAAWNGEGPRPVPPWPIPGVP